MSIYLTEQHTAGVRNWSRRARWLIGLFIGGCALFALSFFTREGEGHLRQGLNIAKNTTLDPLARTSRQKPKRKALIMASFVNQWMDWLQDVPQDWEIYRYVVDDPYANYTVPRNQGQEAMAYTTFIIDHYDDLPDYMVFHHGHDKAWHQPPPMQWLLKAIDLDVLDREQWVSLRCSNWGRCEGPHMYTHPREGNWAMSVILRGIHDFVYRKDDSWYEDLPEDIAVPCCAQFAVTKARTLTKPRDFWTRLRQPLLRDLGDFKDWDPPDAEGTMSWRMGATFEFTWHWFFGMPSVHCPTETFCTNELFRDMVHCDQKTLGPPESFGTWENINCTFQDQRSGPIASVIAR